MKTLNLTVSRNASKTLTLDLQTKADAAAVWTDTNITTATVMVWEEGQDTRGAVDSATTATVVDADRTESNDVWNGRELEFTSGDCAGETRRISDFVSSTHTLTLDMIGDALPATPSADDEYIIRGYPIVYEQDLDGHADGAVSGNSATLQITGANGCTASQRTVLVQIVASYTNGANTDTETAQWRIRVE